MRLWLGPEARPMLSPGLLHWLEEPGEEEGGPACSQGIPARHTNPEEEKPLHPYRMFQGLQAHSSSSARQKSPPPTPIPTLSHFLPSVFSTAKVAKCWAPQIWVSNACLESTKGNPSSSYLQCRHHWSLPRPQSNLDRNERWEHCDSLQNIWSFFLI